MAHILSAALMLAWLGERRRDPQAEAAAVIEAAVAWTLGDLRTTPRT